MKYYKGKLCGIVPIYLIDDAPVPRNRFCSWLAVVVCGAFDFFQFLSLSEHEGWPVSLYSEDGVEPTPCTGKDKKRCDKIVQSWKDFDGTNSGKKEK